MNNIFSFDKTLSFNSRWSRVTAFVRATKEEQRFLYEAWSYAFDWQENVLENISCSLGASHNEEIQVVFRFAEIKNKPSDNIFICFWEPISSFVDYKLIEEKLTELISLSQFSVTQNRVSDFHLALSNRPLKDEKQ